MRVRYEQELARRLEIARDKDEKTPRQKRGGFKAVLLKALDIIGL